MLEAYGTALSHLFTPLPLLALIVGVLLGVVSGAMPAGGLPVLVVLMGFAYNLDPYIAIPLAIGHMAAVPTTDAIPCILLGMPGSATAQATILDGYPLARQGRAGEALAAAYFASLLGGLVGAVGLALSLPVARGLLNYFGSPEFFLLGLVGIGVVGVVSSGAILKGLLAGCLALGIAMIGFDEVAGVARATFGIQYLWDGVPLIPAIIGLFAVPELLDMVVSDTPIARDRVEALMGNVNEGRMRGIRLVLQHKFLVVRSSVLGLLIGMLPGVGGSVAHWLAYVQARQTEKGATKTFGTGDIRGVIAPESANNSIDGGVLIPTLAFALPGSVGMALMLGFFVLLGLQPGPQMLNENLPITVLIVLCLAFSNILVTALALLFTPQMARISVVRPNVLVPLTLVVLTLSAFQVNASMGDIIMVVIFSLLGWFMKRFGWPRPPVIIALVLAPQVEKYLWLSLQTSGVLGMLARPQVWLIGAVIAASVISARRVQARSNAEIGQSVEAADEPVGTAAATQTRARRWLSIEVLLEALFVTVVASGFIYLIVASQRWPASAALVPRIGSSAGLALIVLFVIGRVLAARRGGSRGGGRILDMGFSDADVDPRLARRRTLRFVLSTTSLYLGIWLVGFLVAVPVYVFGYLVRYGRVRWWVAAGTSLTFMGLIWGVYEQVLHTAWNEPLLLRLIGP